MVKMTFGVGLDYDGGGRALGDEAKERMRTDNAIKELSQRFGGCFVTKGNGGWMDGGKLIAEQGLQFTCLSDVFVAKDRAKLAARWLKKEFKQKSVVLTWELCEVLYVED